MTPDRLREVLEYDPDTGIFRWKVRVSNRIHVGHRAGSAHSRGYRRICIDGEEYFAHRLAWLYVHGVWPQNQIDHRNEKKDDNRLSNLREATVKQNCQNRTQPQRNNRRSQVRGVTPHGDRWVARIKADGLTRHLGVFDTSDAAFEAYCAAKRVIHPFWEGASA